MLAYAHLIARRALWLCCAVSLSIVGCGGDSASAPDAALPAEPACGDGHVDPGEQCDDHNSAGGDGCSALCTWDVKAVAAGGGHSCALIGDGTVKCWGPGPGATLGGGRLPGEPFVRFRTMDLGTDRKVVRISAASQVTCAVLDDASLKCWGSGVLGSGSTEALGDGVDEIGDGLPTVDLGTGATVAWFAIGGYHACAVLGDGSLKCWGHNNEGKLGQGDRLDRGFAPGDMGDALPPIDLGSGLKAQRVAVGDNHTCALLTDGSVKCWGNNIEGQLGLGDTDWRGAEAGTMGDALPFVDLGTGRTAVAIAAGRKHTCVVLDTGDIKCWGNNASGTLGIGSDNRGAEPGQMGDNLPAVPLGAGRTGVELTAASQHSCALLDDASLRCWGIGGDGVLGLGRTGSGVDGVQPAVNLGTGLSATYVDTGASHTCVVVDSGNVKCWGYNQAGVLGFATPLLGQFWGDDDDEIGDFTPELDLLD